MQGYSSVLLLLGLLGQAQADHPTARHQLVVVDSADSVVIRLQSYSKQILKNGVLSNENIQYKIMTLPPSGGLSQLSSVYSKYGYTPMNGAKIMTVGTVITGSENRVYYGRPDPDFLAEEKWGTFEFTATGVAGLASYSANVTLVPPSGALVSSNFLFGAEDWTISGNQMTTPYPAKFEAFSRGTLNYYIVGSDDLVNVGDTYIGETGKTDQSLWYFDAPSKFYGNNGIAYGGYISFTIHSFSGDFKSDKLNSDDTKAILLHCKDCEGPVHGGITLALPLGVLKSSYPSLFKGTPSEISVKLLETEGWMKDPQNTLLPWSTPSQCDMIQVLSRLSKIQILGDWTNWYESVALDNVKLSNTKGQLPLCSMARPDASVCTCA